MADRLRTRGSSAATPGTALSPDAGARRAAGEPLAVEPALTPPSPLPPLAQQLAQVIRTQRKPGAVSTPGRLPASLTQSARDADAYAFTHYEDIFFGAGQSLAQRPVGAALRRKPAVSEPGDADEREADSIADRVTGMAQPSGAAIQRKCASCAIDVTEDTDLLRKEHSGGSADLDTASAVRVAQRGGMPMSPGLRAFFEPALGHDFSAVRLHTDAEAGRAARAVQARAYNYGEAIVFGSGEYAPQSTNGRRLLAHELAHVVQQDRTVRRDVSDAGVSTLDPGDAGTSRNDPLDAGAAAATVSTLDPGLVGKDGRPSSAAPLAGTDTTPPWGPDAIGYFDVLLSPDHDFMLHQLRLRVAAAPTLAEGEELAQAWVEEFAASIERGVYDVQDESGVSEYAAAQQVWLQRARMILPVVQDAVWQVGYEHRSFEEEYLARGEFTVAGMLYLSSDRVEAEARRYGLVEHTITTMRRESDGLGGGMVPKVTATYSMSDNTATRGLAAVAGELARKARIVRDRQSEMQSTMQCPTASEFDTNPCGSAAEVAARAASEQALAQARREYDVLRFDKERDYPILAGYADLPNRDGLHWLDKAIERLEGLSHGARGDSALVLYNEINEKRNNIWRTGEALKTNDLVLWELPPAMAATTGDMQLQEGSWQLRWVREAAARHAQHRSIVDIALGALALGLLLLAAIPTGGSSLVAAGAFVAGLGAAGLSTYFAVEHLRQYALESAASGTDFDKARAVSNADPSLFWLAVDIIGAGLDIHGAAAAFHALSGTVREALAARRAATTEEKIAQANAAIERAAQQAEELHPGHGLREQVGQGLRREAGAGREAESTLREWEAGINGETHTYLVDNPEVRARYGEMSPRVREALTFCASNCVLPAATHEQAKPLEALLRTLGEGDMTHLQQYLHARADELEHAIEDIKGARSWQEVEHLIAEEARGMSAPAGENPFADLSEAEIDAALDEMFSPEITGGARPRIGDHAVPSRMRNRLDIQSIVRIGKETARDALARVRRVIGVRLDEIDSVGRCWDRARAQVLERYTLTSSNYADLYDRTRRTFWSNVRDDAEAAEYFRNAGFEWVGGDGTAPLLQTDAAVPATEIRVSLDHIVEKAIGDNWTKALDADNLRMEFAMPNTYREIIQARHPELR